MNSTLRKFLIPVFFILFFISFSSSADAQTCSFRPPRSAAFNFTIDAGNGANVNVPTTIVIRCTGVPTVTFTITDDDGAHKLGTTHRMYDAVGGDYLPYTFTVTPATATIPRNTNTTINLNITVYPIDYQAVRAGIYTDTIVLTLLP